MATSITPATSALQVGQATLGGVIPFAVGYVRARGNLNILFSLSDKTRIALVLLGLGEWDGVERVWINSSPIDIADTALFHFHPGSDGVLGSGFTPVSTGGDQKVDLFFADLPTAIKRLTYSRIAYIMCKVPPDPNAPSDSLDIVGDYRTLKCRLFDNTGAQLAYQFTTNTAWLIFEVIMRYHMKTTSVLNSPLSDAEKARFDFGSFADTAAYCDQILANGDPRYQSSFAWANATTMQAMIEQMLVASNLYLIESQGKIVLRADKPRAYSFTLKEKHLIPKTISFTKNIRTSANKIVGAYNDLGIPSVASIASIVRASGRVTVTTDDTHPFETGDVVDIGGVDDASFDDSFKIDQQNSDTTFSYPQAGPDATSAHGKVGMYEARFTKRAPIVEHFQQQVAIGQRGLGLAALPKKTKLSIDFGNSDWDQTNRVMKFQLMRQLGPMETPYIAPRQCTLQAVTDAVDDDGNALLAQQCGDYIMLDESVDNEFQDEYEIVEKQFKPSPVSVDRSGDQVEITEFVLLQKVPEAWTDVSDDEPDLNSTVPGSVLTAAKGSVNQSYTVILSAPITAADAGTSVTVTVPSFEVEFGGRSALVDYTGGTLLNAPYSTDSTNPANLYVYCDDPDMKGGARVLHGTSSKQTAIGAPGRILIGFVPLPTSGGSSSTGGDGGSGPGPLPSGGGHSGGGGPIEL